MIDINDLFAPVREQAYHVVMLVHGANPDRDVEIASITAVLEGTMAAAIQILGAEDAFNVIQPLIDKVLNAAIVAKIERVIGVQK